ncbi:MAG: peptidyl-prolyl cis-trans isomerase [Nitrospirae bacterium]|nr:peptidyl-prolyl cis-trans isomerase [Nitrospirota bacterium]
MRKFLALVICCLFVAACSKGADQPKTASGGDYLIKINDVTISKADLDKELKKMPEEFRQTLMRDAQTYIKFLEDYANKEALGFEAKSKNVQSDPDYISKIEYIKKVTAIQMLLEKEVAKKDVKISDRDVQAYYNENKDQFGSPASFRVSHIQVKTRADADKVKDRLNKGEDFAKIAKELSEDKETAKNGGDLGILEPGRLPAGLDQVVQKMKKGEVSAPVNTQLGFHILKITDVKQGSALDLNTIKEDIRRVMQQDKQQAMFEKYIEDVKKKYKIDINKSEVDKIVKAANQGKPKSEQQGNSHAGEQNQAK